MGVDRFDRCSNTLHWACVQYVTYSEWRAWATAQTTPIFNKYTTLVFFEVRIPMWNIFRYEYSIHMRILHKKNKQNWTSGSWDIGIVLHLRSDRYWTVCPVSRWSSALHPVGQWSNAPWDNKLLVQQPHLRKTKIDQKYF